MTSNLWHGVGSVILLDASGFGFAQAMETTSAQAWQEQACAVVSTDMVDVGDETRRVAIEARLRPTGRPTRATSEPLRLATYENRALAEAKAQRYRAGAAVPCWVNPDGEGVRALATTTSHVVTAWLLFVVALAHLLLLLALWRNDLQRAATSVRPERHPAWLPKTLLHPADGFVLEVKPRPHATDVLYVRYKAHGYGPIALFFVLVAYGCAAAGVPHLETAATLSWESARLVPFGGWAFSLLLLFSQVRRGLDIRFDKTSLRGSVSGGWTQTRIDVSRHAVRGVVQTYDTPESDSFATWGLMLEAESAVELLTRQPRDKGQWLGGVIAAWAGKTLQVDEPATRTAEPE